MTQSHHRCVLLTALRLIDLRESGGSGHNLLAQTRKHINLSSNDVQWRPQHESQLATGATTGDVLLWDTTRRGDALLRTLRGNSRAVNRLCFSPEAPTQLLVAAHERTVRLWDVGQRIATQQLAFATAAEARDVQFCPHMPTRFMVALENGMLQVRCAVELGAHGASSACGGRGAPCAHLLTCSRGRHSRSSLT